MQVRMLNLTLKNGQQRSTRSKMIKVLEYFCVRKISNFFFFSTAYDSIAFICWRIFDYSFCCSWMLLPMRARAWARAYILFVSRNCIICGTHTLNKNAYSRAKCENHLFALHNSVNLSFLLCFVSWFFLPLLLWRVPVHCVPCWPVCSLICAQEHLFIQIYRKIISK